MTRPDYLRRTARRCVTISRATYDLATARQLRALADELLATAAELDEAEADVPAYMMQGGRSNDGRREQD